MQKNQIQFLITLFLLVCASSISLPSSKQQASQRARTVVDINRYYSIEHKRANYNISNMVQGHPLIFTLLKSNKISQLLKEGLTIVFKAEMQQTTCRFKKTTDLCVVPEVTKDFSMVIQCQKLPCEVEWKIYQPTPLAPSSRQPALNLYNLEATTSRLIGEITCNDPQLTTLDQDVIAYSESNYVRAYHNNVLYLLFTSFDKGYVYVDVASSTQKCAEIAFTNVPATLTIQNNATIKDFVTKTSKTVYQFKEIPAQDFVVECEALRLDNFEGLKYSLQVSLVGVKDGKHERISTAQIRQTSQLKSQTAQLYFKSTSTHYSQLLLEFLVQDSQIFLLILNLLPASAAQLEVGDTVYFSLRKGDSIQLKVKGQEDSQSSDRLYLLEKTKEELKLSAESCKAAEGCQVTIQALSDTHNMLYLSSQNQTASVPLDDQGKGRYQFEEIEFMTVKHSFKHKIRLGESIFLRKEVQAGHSYKVQVNSANVLMYAAEKSKCHVPDAKCRERTANLHHPFVYQSTVDGQLLINVEGLDNTQFELTIIDNNSVVQLSDAVPFSYSMDEAEESIDFTFALKDNEKSDISLNLIAPLNALTLRVSYPTTGQGENQVETSSDGYIEISKQSFSKGKFSVKISKARPSDKYSSHFTLIASSSKSQLRLQPAQTHYQTLSPNSSRQYIFEFSNSEDYVLSFSVYNLKDGLDFQLLYSKDGKWESSNAIELRKEVQFVELTPIAQMLCQQQRRDSCQVFIKILNRMPVQAEFSAVLLSKSAVIELKQGIWQSFPASQLVASSSFYFFPRHNQHDLLLFYHSILSRLRVAYRLWRYDRDSINPQSWPFPLAVDPALSSSNSSQQAQLKQSNFIAISKEQVKRICWPNCVLLVNFYLQPEPTQPLNYFQSSQFRIMASDNRLELPQNHKASFTLSSQEDRQVMVDLKYPLTRTTLTFYSAQTLGQCTLAANLYSQSKQNCPIVDQSPDFTLWWGENPLKVSAIKQVLKAKGMQDDKNIYLCVAVHAEESCKLSLEYTAQDDPFKEIYVDSFEDIRLQTNQTRFYQIDCAVEHTSKLARLRGFPFVALKNCPDKADLAKCKLEFLQSSDKGTQIVVKTESFDQPLCLSCTLLIKFSTIQPAELSLHTQSKYSEMELKEKVFVSDFLNENEVNKYQIHADKEQELIVNIHVQEGTIQAKLTDGAELNLIRQSTPDRRIVQFIVKSSSGQKRSSQAGTEQPEEGLANPMALSNSLVIYHLEISSLRKDIACSYSLGYSCGRRQFFLQDGLIVDYELQPSKVHSLFYCNSAAKEHIFFTVSTHSPDFLSKLALHAFSFQDFAEQSQRKPLGMAKPSNFNRKTPNPMLVFELKSENCIEVQLTNPTAKTESVSVGVNHQQVVLLPFDHEYPFVLHPNEYLNILTDVNIPGFIDLEVRKCDQSTPTLGYTFDYDSFIKGEYMYEAMLTEESSFRYHIKANRIGTLYLKLQAATETSTATVRMVHSEAKVKLDLIRAGNHGLLHYEIIDQKSAKIIFSAVECAECKNIKYMAVTSDSQQTLYQQMVCPSTYFSATKLATRIPIANPTLPSQELSFVLDLQGRVEYVGVMAVTSTGQQIFYRPIEVGSLWSKWEQNSVGHQLMMLLIVLVAFCVLAIWIRRMSRKGYRPLDQAAE